MPSVEIVAVNCENWECGNAPIYCHGGCPNHDPHDLPISEIPPKYQEFFRENGLVEVS